MNRLSRYLLLAATSCAAANLASAQLAPPQPPAGPIAAPSSLPGPAPGSASVYDLQQLPVIKGSVSHYTLTPRGDVDGLILGDGTEVHVPPHLSTQLVYAVKLGDTITVRGLKALNVPLVAAIAITNDATNQRVVDGGAGFSPGPKGPREAGQPISVQGRVQMTLHGPRGEVDGAMLEDGTILRLPPPEAERRSSMLSPGQTIAAQGDGLVTPMGRIIEIQAIGPSQAQLNWVQQLGLPPGECCPRP